MVATVPFNPTVTTNGAGGFVVQSDGLVQGTFYADPAARFALRGGILDTAETIPMWGGVGIYENIPNLAAGNPSETLGPVVGRATTLTGTSSKGLSGFSVFDQAHAMVTTPQSPVPLAASSMSVHYFRLGSGARVAVQCDPGLASLEGGVVGQQVSWDFNNQVLQEYDASTATIAITAATWASTSGGQITATVANWTGAFQPAAGDVLNISGATNTGTGGAAAVNTDFVVVSATATQVVLAAPAAAGVFGTIGGSPVFNFGTGALNVRVDRVLVGNSMVVLYNPTTGFASWNRTGTAAIITL